MSDKYDGGQAFPGDQRTDTGVVYETASGMSLRDYFAGQAACGYFACYADKDAGLPPATEVARKAYEYADAMLKAREQ